MNVVTIKHRWHTRSDFSGGDGVEAWAPIDQGHVFDISPADPNLADSLFLNKLIIWNQPHLTGRHRFDPETSPGWEWPVSALNDPEA